MITRRILAPKNQTPRNAANATKPHQTRRAKRPLPLAPDIVGLVRHGGGNVGIRARGDEEDAEIAGAGVGGEAHDGQADEGDEGVEHDDGAAHVVLVGQVGGAEHEDAGQDVGGRDEALGGAHAETHADEDDGQEVGDGVGDGCDGAGGGGLNQSFFFLSLRKRCGGMGQGIQEDECKSPDLEI